VGELVEPQAMEPKGGTLESRSTMNACLHLLCLYQKTLPSRKAIWLLDIFLGIL
jgi:hypothetical protein